MIEDHEKQISIIMGDSNLKETFNAGMKELELERKNKKYANVKIKEQQEEANRKQRNLERIKKSENVKIKEGRREKTRSEKPNLVRIIKTFEPTQDELDYAKYVANL